MLHIATVHWQDDRWIDIQLKYLNSYIKEPFRMYAFLNGISDEHRKKYFYSSCEPIKYHSIKLNILADIASAYSEDPSDLLMFIDGDAFPIGDILSFGRQKLTEYPLIAIQRRENWGDIQPHPSFCLTTVGFWKEIDGDWKMGYSWINESGRLVTDVGGNLLKILREKKILWYPILRNNRLNLHPLWFGIYEDLIYHHGAGFRVPLSRFDMAKMRSIHLYLYERLPWEIRRRIPEKYHPFVRLGAKNKNLSDKVFHAIESDPFFFRLFQGENSPSEVEEFISLT